MKLNLIFFVGIVFCIGFFFIILIHNSELFELVDLKNRGNFRFIGDRKWERIKVVEGDGIIRVTWRSRYGKEKTLLLDQRYCVEEIESCTVVYENEAEGLYGIANPCLMRVIKQSLASEIAFEFISLKDTNKH